MVLSDAEIMERCDSYSKRPMISPFTDDQVKFENDRKIISYGLSSYGYDARLDGTFFVPTAALDPTGIIDPKDFKKECLTKFEGDSMVIPPNSFVIGQTLEVFNIPRDLLVLCTGKSTYSRCGVIPHITTLEPEWRGHVTMSICNLGPMPARVYAREGICQFVFVRSSRTCLRSYADRAGKYQDQTSITLPKV